MTLRRENEQKARELRGQGKSLQEIAETLLISERTLRRWGISGDSENRKPTDESKLWPDWTPNDLERIAKWTRPQSEENIAIVQMARSQKNIYIPWFYRQIVEVTAENEDIAHINQADYSAWLFAIAGLPVLAEWIDCPECNELGDLIREMKPWEQSNDMSKRQKRNGYSRKAGTLAAVIKRRLLLYGTYANMDRNRKREDVPLPVLFNALAQRIPMFDKAPLLSLFRNYNIGAILNLIFQAERPATPNS